MRTLCPNLDREDGLETVLEVPIPEEMFASPKHRTRQNMKYHTNDKSAASVFGSRDAEIQLLLGVVGAPLIPHPIRSQHSLNAKINDHPIEASMAKYIVQQYIAAAGGERALNSINSMYAMGKIKMMASEFTAGDGMGLNKGNVMKIKSVKNGTGEMGGFVLWQKRPDLWSIELVVSGCKLSAGSDGKVAWRQTPWHHSHASRGPARPLRRSLQGLDPKSVANLFSTSICIGEKTVNDEDCFVLKLEAEPSTLKARSSSKVEVMRHTMWGYFSQRTGLLFQLEDTHLLRIKAPGNDVFWETTMESLILDYRTIDGVNIAHAGRTSVSLFRFGENSSEGHTRTRMEEVWTIEEVDFNIKGLSADCFLPPSDLKKEEEVNHDINKKSRLAETIFFDNTDPEEISTFDPPERPDDFIETSSFDDGPMESEEDIAKAYEELYGAAYSGETFLGNDIYVMDSKVKKTTGFGKAKKEKAKDGFDERVVQVRRVTKVVKGGKQLHFRAIVVVGDKNGQVGVGVGKAKEVIAAVQKSAVNARRNLIKVPMTKYLTFPHRSDGDFGAARVMLRPAAPGTGVIAGGAVRIVLEMAGVENALGKQLGSNNALNNARATVVAVQKMRQFSEVAQERGIPMEELWK